MLFFQRLLKQDKERFTVPHSVQQSIPIKHIWPDGIFKVGSKFSKCWRFDDINYSVASTEDKTAMFLGYSDLLNSLDVGATTKITINNRRLNKVDFENSILIKNRDDGLDHFRDEYNAMLMDKATGSHNSIVQEKYITVSVRKKNIEEARVYFNRIHNDISSRLAQLSSRAAELNAGERLRIFHDFFRIGEETNYNFDLKETLQKGHDIRDYICPDSIEFEKDCFQMDDRYARVLYLREYASYLKDTFITELMEHNRNMMLSIDILPVPTDEAIKLAQNTLLGIETNAANWQRKQNQSNNFSAVLPYEIEQQRKETKEYIDDLTSRDQRMMFIVVTLVHVADTKEQLDSDTESILSVAKKHMCQMSSLKWQQYEGVNTALPYGLRRVDALRTMTTEAVAVLMPFRTQEIMDTGGIYYGQNTISKNLIIANRMLLLNGNGFILGVSGSGKSFVAKRELISLILSTGDDVLIADPQNEYAPLTRGLGGTVIEISESSRHHINAMDMSAGYGDEDNPLISKSEFVLSFCEQLVGTGKLGAREKSIIDRCMTNVYRQYLKSNYTQKPPTLKELYQELKRQPEPQAKDIALSLEMVTNGNLNVFAHQTNVNVDNRLIAYGIRDLGKQLKTVGMLVMLDAIRNRVARNREKGKRTHVFIDEMHIFFGNELSSNFLSESWKQFRKDGALATGITQNVEDCLKSVTARTMLANSEFIVMLNQAPTDRMELAKLLNISETQLSYITNASAGQGLLKCVGSIVPFADKFPRDTELYKLMTTKPGEVIRLA
ncbi:MAG: ATP-binding protein [candidate division Zixibacteria bacterium]|nr:ATP-binding protein [candidate division Zixibacteria bacterium]